MMQRRVGQHDAQFVIVWSNFWKFYFCRRKNDRSGGRYQQNFGFPGKLDQIVSGLEIARHQCKGFFFAVFPLAQSRNSPCVSSITRQVVSTESFQRENAAVAKQLRGFANARFISTYDASVGAERVIRSAGWARYRLRMKAAVARIVIFRVAIIVQRPALHGSVGPVVRQTKNNRIARTAVGAVDIGIQIARISWIKKFFQTSLTDRQVRRNANRRPLATLALADGEFV